MCGGVKDLDVREGARIQLGQEELGTTSNGSSDIIVATNIETGRPEIVMRNGKYVYVGGYV